MSDLIFGFTFFGGITLIVFILARFNYLIKKTAYENGIAPNESYFKLRVFELGCTVVGVGLGLGLSAIFMEFDLAPGTKELIVYAFTLCLGGAGMIISHVVRKRQDESKHSE
ncbi:MAG: hypothetical protein AAGC71_11285 [Pseudomonadota bacterium]